MALQFCNDGGWGIRTSWKTVLGTYGRAGYDPAFVSSDGQMIGKPEPPVVKTLKCRKNSLIDIMRIKLINCAHNNLDYAYN
jgi:hypothetical protein